MSGAIAGSRVRAPKRGPEWLSGFCNPSNDKKSHARCKAEYAGHPCSCECHQTSDADAPTNTDSVVGTSDESGPSASASEYHGFYDDLDEVEYHAHPGSLSVSGAKVILKAPALFQWQRHHRVHKKAFEFGSAAHKLVLGAGPEIVVVQREFRDKKGELLSVEDAGDFMSASAKEHRDAIRADGKIPLLRKEYQQVQDMADNLSSHTLAMQLLSEGKPEVSAFAPDDATGVLRRSRFDWLSPGILSDYKSAASSDPDDFDRTALNFGYFMQAPWYLDLARDLGLDVTAFAFIVQAKEPPYLVTVIELDRAFMQMGRERNREALERYRDCTASGLWPGYIPDTEFATVSPPAWATRREAMA